MVVGAAPPPAVAVGVEPPEPPPPPPLGVAVTGTPPGPGPEPYPRAAQALKLSASPVQVSSGVQYLVKQLVTDAKLAVLHKKMETWTAMGGGQEGGDDTYVYTVEAVAQAQEVCCGPARVRHAVFVIWSLQDKYALITAYRSIVSSLSWVSVATEVLRFNVRVGVACLDTSLPSDDTVRFDGSAIEGQNLRNKCSGRGEDCQSHDC